MALIRIAKSKARKEEILVLRLGIGFERKLECEVKKNCKWKLIQLINCELRTTKLRMEVQTA